MPFYSDELVEEVRSRSDIVDVISQYVKLQKKGSSYFGLCPFHNEKTGSFSVTPSKQMYYCFGCGAGGNVFSFVMNYENFSFPETMEYLAERAGVELPKTEQTKEDRERADKRSLLLQINKEAAMYYYKLLRSPRGAQALAYFEGRALKPETMQKFGLGYSDKYSDDLYRYLKTKGYSDELLRDSGLISLDEKKGGHDKFWNRAMFPIMDVHNKVIGFGGRVMGEGEPKYLNSPETMIFDKSRNLYGLNLARQSKREGILLCEGYMDVIALHQAGFDHAVASLGTSFTTGHASLLKRYAKEVYLTFDSDGAGIKAALRAIPILKEVGLSAKIVHMEPYKDPDEFIQALGAEEYQKRIDQAENSFLFEIRILQRDYDMKDPESKTAFYNAVAVKLLGFEEELERNNYVEAVAEQFHMPYDKLLNLVNTMGSLGGAVKEKRVLKSGMDHKKEAEDAAVVSQKVILTWLVERPELYSVVKNHLEPADFEPGLLQNVAKLLYEQLEVGKPDVAKIPMAFDAEDHPAISESFHTNLKEVSTDAELSTALSQMITNIKLHGIERIMNDENSDGNAKFLAASKRNQLKLSGIKITL